MKPSRVRAFAREHPDAAEALLNWLAHVQHAAWRNIVEVRRTFAHADPVTVRSGNVATVFNIRGNRYRLIVAIKYEWSMVYVLRFLTHAQYSTDRWKQEL